MTDKSSDSNNNYLLSKTALKKEMLDLQDLGKSLINLSPKELNHLLNIAKVNPSDHLLQSIEEAQKLKSGNALRRQIQLIGKLLRHKDYKPLKFYLDNPKYLKHSKKSYPSNKISSEWLNRLMSNNDTNQEISEFTKYYPDGNRQQLSQLIRNAKKQCESNSAITKLKKRIETIIEDKEK